MSCFEQRPLFDSTVQTASFLPQADIGKPHITEITLNSNAHLAKAILAGMLMELSGNADQRWLCWVAECPLKSLLSSTGSENQPQRILQVVGKARGSSDPARNRELSRIAARALETGKSHTVAVMVNQPLAEADRAMLAQAAISGNAECLLILLQS